MRWVISIASLLFTTLPPAPLRRLDQSTTVPAPTTASGVPLYWHDKAFGILLEDPVPLGLTRRLLGIAQSHTKTVQHADMYGGIYDYAYYFISILVGTPPQRQSVILDSGSSLLGFPCSECVHCGKQHIDRGFVVSESSTAKRMSCSDSKCLTKRCGSNGMCRYSQGYSEGSSIEGTFVSDMVALGEIADRSDPIRFDYIGCHDRETNLFTTQKASGIFGVSYPKRGKQPTLIDALFESPLTDTKVFSICASEDGGELTVGGFNSSKHLPSMTKPATRMRLLSLSQSLRHDVHLRSLVYPEESTWRKRGLKAVDEPEPQDYMEVLYNSSGLTDQDDHGRFLGENINTPPIAWTPITSTSSYQIDVNKIQMVVGENKLEDVATRDQIGSVIVDSGTTFSYLASSAFKSFMEYIDKACVDASNWCISRAKTSSDQLCWNIENPQTDFKHAPSFLLTLGSGAIVEWGPESYLHRRAKTNTWCLAVDDNLSRTSILGMSFLKGQDVIFDRERDLVGFVRAACKVVPDTTRPTMPAGTSGEAQPTIEVQDDAASNWLSEVTDSYVVTTDSPGYSPLGKKILPSSFGRPVMWASGGIGVALCATAMVAITRRSMRRSTEYERMEPDESAIEATRLRQVDPIPYHENDLSEAVQVRVADDTSAEAMTFDALEELAMP